MIDMWKAICIQWIQPDESGVHQESGVHHTRETITIFKVINIPLSSQRFLPLFISFFGSKNA